MVILFRLFQSSGYLFALLSPSQSLVVSLSSQQNTHRKSIIFCCVFKLLLFSIKLINILSKPVPWVSLDFKLS